MFVGLQIFQVNIRISFGIAESPGWRIWAGIFGLIFLVWIIATINYGLEEGYWIAMVLDSIIFFPFIFWLWISGGFEEIYRGGGLDAKKTQEKPKKYSKNKKVNSELLLSESMGNRDFIKQLPNRLGAIIAGLILYVNAEFIGNSVPNSYGDFVNDNMELVAGILIGLSLLRLGIDWYLVSTEENDAESGSE